MEAKFALVVCLLLSLLSTGNSHGEVSTGSLGRYRPYSVRDVGDRVFFTSIPEPGKPHEFNIFELREGTDSPRPLLTPAEAARYRLHDTFIVRPGAPHNLLYASAQLDASPSGEWRNCLVLVDAESTGVRILADNGRDNRNPSFSADGRMVAFWSGSPKIAYTPIALQDEGYALHVVDVNSGKERELVGADAIPAASGPPAWSPDGRRIAFVQARSGVGRRIHLINVDGSGLLTPAPKENYEPEHILWVDVSRIIFTHTGGPGLSELDLTAGKVSTAKAGGYRAPLELTPDRKHIRTSFEDSAGLRKASCVLRVSDLEHVPELEARTNVGY